MTSTINQVSQSISASVSAHVDAIVIVLLLTLLAEQELVQAYRGGSATADLRPMRIVVVPLLAAFVLIVSVRVLGLR
jgi:23S rRNA maturation mini-RNase III